MNEEVKALGAALRALQHSATMVSMRARQHMRIREHMDWLRAKGHGQVADALLTDLEKIEIDYFPDTERSQTLKRRLEERHEATEN